MHFDGVRWVEMPTPTTETLLDVWGFVDGPVYAVGTNGTILRRSGSSWVQMDSPRIQGRRWSRCLRFDWFGDRAPPTS